MELIKPGKHFDFMGSAKTMAIVSGAAVLISLILVLGTWTGLGPGLNFGTDFKGGTELQIGFLKPVDAGHLRATIESLGYKNPDVVHATIEGQPHAFLVRIQDVTTVSAEQEADLKEALCFEAKGGGAPAADRCPAAHVASEFKLSPGGDKVTLRYAQAPDVEFIRAAFSKVPSVKLRSGQEPIQVLRESKVEVNLESKGDILMSQLVEKLGNDTVPSEALGVEWVGPKAGQLLIEAAFKSILISMVFMMAYIAFRFDIRFAPGAIIALIHDVLITMGVYVILGKPFTLMTVAALLTIVGYSVNDTVIVYDRIRENLGRLRGKSFPEIINVSVSETLSRTVLTSFTTVVTLVALMLLGTGAIKDFAFAMTMGIAVGTYSSIYVASPLTHFIDKKFFAARKSVAAKAPIKREAAVV